MNTPKPKTLQALLQFYITKYYERREAIPGLKHDNKKHIHEVEKINKQYLKILSKTSWDSEENREQFKKEIDFLTKVFSKQKEEEDRKKALQEFKNYMVRKPVTTI